MRFTYTEWIPVSSRVPNTPIPVLVFVRHDDGIEMQIARYRGKSWFVENDDGYELTVGNITHWTKLPKGPA